MSNRSELIVRDWCRGLSSCHQPGSRCSCCCFSSKAVLPWSAGFLDTTQSVSTIHYCVQNFSKLWESSCSISLLSITGRASPENCTAPGRQWSARRKLFDASLLSFTRKSAGFLRRLELLIEYSSRRLKHDPRRISWQRIIWQLFWGNTSAQSSQVKLCWSHSGRLCLVKWE